MRRLLPEIGLIVVAVLVIAAAVLGRDHWRLLRELEGHQATPVAAMVTAPAASTSTPAASVYTYAQGYAAGGQATYTQLVASENGQSSNGDAEWFCGQADPSADAGNDSDGVPYSQASGSSWFKGCVAAIASPASAVSKGTWQAGYEIGMHAEPLRVQRDGGARGWCSSAASEAYGQGQASLLRAGCVAALQAQGF